MRFTFSDSADSSVVFATTLARVCTSPTPNLSLQMRFSPPPTVVLVFPCRAESIK